MHFASELFESHPRFVQLKSMLLDFFNGEVIDSICLAGIEHVISVTLGPTPASLNSTAAAALDSMGMGAPDDTASLPKVHLRTYTVRMLASGTRVPRVELTAMGPSLDMVLRRHAYADAEMAKQAMRRPKLAKKEVAKGLGKKRKNVEVDEMGDMRGRIHVARQDLGRLQTRKMKGLKGGKEEEDGEDAEGGDGEAADEEEGGRKHRRKE